MAYLGALQSASSLRRAASSNSCLPASVRLHQCMCWIRFELHRIPWKVQPGSRDCASSSWLRALAAYSLQLRIGTTPLSPRHESSVFRRSPYSRPRSRGDAPLHQLPCSTGSGLHRGPAKLQPVAIWTWLIARATYSSQLSIGSGPSLSERRCREQSDGGQESYGDYGFHHLSSSWTMRPVAAVNGSPRAGELRTQ